MASSDDTTRVHPVCGAVVAMTEQVAAVADVPLWSMTGDETHQALVALTRLTAQQAELQARLLVHAESIEAFAGLSAASGLAAAATVTRREARAAARLATQLEQHQLTRAAMAKGRLHAEQARVICQAVDALPDDAAPGLRHAAEQHLVEQAEKFDAKALEILGRRVLEVVDPEAADAHEAQLLEAEEAAARRATRFTMADDGHGQVHGRFTLTSAQGATLRKALLAIAAPKHRRAEHGAGSYDHTVASPQRMGAAFAEYVETYPADALPSQRGVNATVIVTMTLDALLGGLRSAELDAGEHISAGEARRLACTAGIVPAVFGGDSAVLDLGRTRRLFSIHQLRAKRVTHAHCEHAGCDVPASLCHLHHPVPWARGGTTDLAHAILLCPRHHHLIHATPILRV